MIKKTKLLCAFALFLFIGSLAATGVNAYVTTTVGADEMLPAVTYGDDRRNEAVSILIYNEATDLSPDEEYDHVMGSLIGSLEGRFTYDNLTDYTLLDSVIGEFDVLLILEQELGNVTFCDTVNAAWAGILPSFVADGGIVICMSFDFGNAWTSRIINGTLMDIYNPSTAHPVQMDVFDSNDALARNMATYTSVSGTSSFDIPDAVKVIEANSNAKHVVSHKVIGKGHVVHLGLDMYTVDANQDILLMNAILLHRHIVFDNSHGQTFSISSDFGEIANDLPYYGFSVSSMDTFDPDILAACEIFIVSAATITYNATEIDILHNFVNDGGGLFIASEWGTFGNEIDGLINDFGFVRNTTDTIRDSDENAGDTGWPDLAQPDNFEVHSANLGVDIVELYYATGFTSIPAGAVPLVVTDTDGTATWSGVDIASGIPLAAADLVGDGRLVVLGDTAPFRSSDIDSDGSSAYTDSDNELFLRNCFRWLAGAGIPEQTVVFDQSHSPYTYVHSGWSPLAYLLMFNGYNVEWMYTFDPAVYETADILVICDGSSSDPYNTTEIGWITNYVAGGGGLILWGDNGAYSDDILPIGLEFGLPINNVSGYIEDSDDFNTYSSVINYYSSNFANHPIMDGVQRIEVDRSNALNSSGSGVALISTDNDGTATWSAGSVPANNLPVFAVTLFGMGRVAVLTDVNLGTATDADSDGFSNLYDSDNPVFVANLCKWLAENRAPSVEVLSPNGGELLNGTITVSWDAVDFDSDPLTFDVYVSDNNGSDWSLLASGLTLEEYEWNTTLHDDGTSYMIRVDVSDGVLQGTDASDDPFELDNFAGPFPPLPISPTMLAIIAGAIIVVVVILIFVSKKKGGGK